MQGFRLFAPVQSCRHDVVMNVAVTAVQGQREQSRPGGRLRSFGFAMIALAAWLTLNTLLGPLVTGLVDYPISEGVQNQLIGLEIITVAIIAPLCIAAGFLAIRGHRAAGVLGFGPAAYTAYMFVQYVLGPEYENYRLITLFQLGVFTFGVGLAIWAWTLIDSQSLPVLRRRQERRYGVVLLALAGFVILRYSGAIAGSFTAAAIPVEFIAARTFYWTIFLLDLGVVVPATIVAGIALIRGTRAGHTAMYAFLGWYALVSPSVASMAAVMVVNDDPDGSVGQVVLLCCVAMVFGLLTAWMYRPFFGVGDGSGERHAPDHSGAPTTRFVE